MFFSKIPPILIYYYHIIYGNLLQRQANNCIKAATKITYLTYCLTTSDLSFFSWCENSHAQIILTHHLRLINI